MHSHLLLLTVFSLLVSVVFALLTKDEMREQVRFGSMLFAGFLASALLIGWLMYPVPL